MELTTAMSTKVFHRYRRRNGTMPRHLEQDVVLPSIQTERPFSENKERDKDKEKVLLALFMGMSTETMSGDQMYLAMHRAKEFSSQMGVKEETFNEIVKSVIEAWERVRKLNPLHSMF